MKKMNNKGFSLVELIVVIAIMAVLVGVLAPQFIKYVEKSRQSTDIQNVDSIRTVVEAYYSDKDGDKLPKKVTITLKASADPAVVTDPSTLDGSLALKDGGVEKNRLKSKEWGDSGIVMEYNPVDGTWKYTGKTQIYKVEDNDKFVLE